MVSGGVSDVIVAATAIYGGRILAFVLFMTIIFTMFGLFVRYAWKQQNQATRDFNEFVDGLGN
jgi:hypothetical protein